MKYRLLGARGSGSASVEFALVAHGRAYQRDWKSARPGSAAAPAASAYLNQAKGVDAAKSA
jgi:hypothetical protein